MTKVLCIEHVHPAGEALLAGKVEMVFPEPQTEAGILAVIGDCEGVIVRNTRVTPALLAAAPRLKVIGRHGVGFDNVNVAAASELAIPVVYTPGANTESVAEVALAFLICLGRKIPQAHAAMRKEALLSDSETLSVTAQRYGLGAFDLWGKTLGVIGVGRVGSRLARKAIAALGMKVLGYDPYVDAQTLAGYGVEKVERLADLLPRSDFVSLHCPGGAETRHMMNAATLAMMKPSAYLLNTARGSVVDAAALLAALRGGVIAGAALDVFDPEPPLAGDPLVQMENVIVTPHYCAMTEESLYNMGTMVAQGVLDVLEGRRPQHLVNPEIWDRRR